MHPVWRSTCTAVAAAAAVVVVRVLVHGEIPIAGFFSCGSWLCRTLTLDDHLVGDALFSDGVLPSGDAALSGGGGGAPVLGSLLPVLREGVSVVSACRRRGGGVAFSGSLRVLCCWSGEHWVGS